MLPVDLKFSVQVDGEANGFENMARDRVLGHALPEARVYRWDGPWVSLGKNQNPNDVFLAGATCPWTVRPTGGKAVLHGHDLTLSIAIPGQTGRRVRNMQSLVLRPLVTALQMCGVDALLCADTRRVDLSHDCFRAPAAGDVIDRATGSKLVGCAFRMSRDHVLAQCSIPCGQPLVNPQDLFELPHLPAPVNIPTILLCQAVVEAYGQGVQELVTAS